MPFFLIIMLTGVAVSQKNTRVVQLFLSIDHGYGPPGGLGTSYQL